MNSNLPTGYDGLSVETVDYIETVTRWMEADLDEKLGRDLVDREVRLRTRVNTNKAEEKAPHLAANAEIEARHKELLNELAAAVAHVKARLELALKEAQRIAREKAETLQREADAAAKLAAAAAPADEDDPFARLDEREATRAAEEAESAARRAKEVAARPRLTGHEQGRALSMRTIYDIEVVDGPALVTFFATSPALQSTAKSIALAMVKAAKGENPAGIPGIKIISTEKL